jgi:hypothetical protein
MTQQSYGSNASTERQQSSLEGIGETYDSRLNIYSNHLNRLYKICEKLRQEPPTPESGNKLAKENAPGMISGLHDLNDKLATYNDGFDRLLNKLENFI